MAPAAHPFEKVVKELTVSGATHRYFSLPALSDPRVARLPHSIRVLLESAVRNCDGFAVTEADVAAILDWEKLAPQGVEVQYKPARVMLQDFTGVPAVVDLAAMREATKALGGDPERINPLVNVHAVVDHSLQVDVSASPEAAEENARIEFERNHERFRFLKWGQGSFRNMTVTPPSNAIVHQLNLEYACRSVCRDDKTGTVYLELSGPLCVLFLFFKGRGGEEG
jgi:aconitate hydratase